MVWRFKIGALLLANVSVVIGCHSQRFPSAEDSGGEDARAEAKVDADVDVERARAVADDNRQLVRREFVQIADRLVAGDNPYLGRLQIDQVRQSLRRTTSTAGRLGLQFRLSGHLLRIGDTAAAVAQVESAFQQLAKTKRSPSVEMHKARTIAYLRHAEAINCVQGHHPECCVFPLKGRGIHQDPSAMYEARRSILAVLKAEPHARTFQWLLNLVTMALGESLDSVPAAYRLPETVVRKPHQPSRGASLGIFPDVAPWLKIDTFNLCGGVAANDFDGDGYLDIITSTFDPHGSLRFFRNTGREFEDGSKKSGLDTQLGGLNCVSADYDNDGDMDLLVLRGAWLGKDGRIRNSLLRNRDGMFDDVTHQAGLADPARPTQSAAWGDFDNDGDLDLYIGNEFRRGGPEESGNHPNQLFQNQGNGSFHEVTAAAGVENSRFCKGVAAGDFDNDGWLDIYVSNVGSNRLYRNRGDGTFEDVAVKLGVTGPDDRSFACWFFDYDNDGWLDIFVAGYSATAGDLIGDYREQPHNATLPRLYRNLGGRHGRSQEVAFIDVARDAGLAHAYLPMGANFGDLDGDGYLDIFLATGDPKFESLMPNVALLNVSSPGSGDRRRFEDVTVQTGMGHLQKGHGVAFADFDHDGDQDLYNQLGGFYPGDAYHNALFLNPGNRRHHSLAIQLQGTTSNCQGIGTRIEVEVETANGRRTIHRAVGAVSSFGGSPNRVEIGLGEARRICRLQLEWPASGRKQSFTTVPMDGLIRIVEDVDRVEQIQRREVDFGLPGTD